MDWSRNVLKSLLAQIDELDSDLSQNLIVGRRRDADTTRFCYALNPCSNIYAISKDVMRLDDYVADIDAHTESNAPIFRMVDCKVVDAGLELHGCSNRFDGARKLRQEPVTRVLDNAAAVFCDRWGDSVRQERCQFGVCRLFVIVHEPRVASRVGGQYGRQPALDPD